MLSIPPSPEAISPAWLHEALSSSGALNRATVVSIEVSPVPAGSGFIAQAARIRIQYDLPEPGAPTSVFIKMSSADATVRAQLRMLGFYESEIGFYRDLAVASGFPLRVPRAYVSMYDHGSGARVLALEDLSGRRFGDNLNGCCRTDAQIALCRIARLHAHFWDSPELEHYSWLRAANADVEQRCAVYNALLPRFEERCREILPEELRVAARRLVPVLRAYLDQYGRPPLSLIHGDYRPDNVAFNTAADDDDVVVFDWQLVRRSRAARDVAYFLCAAMPPDERRACENRLLREYHDTLVAGGVTGYSFDDLLRDFRIGIGTLLIATVGAVGLLDFSSERGFQLARQLCERTSAAVADHEFARYLEQLD